MSCHDVRQCAVYFNPVVNLFIDYVLLRIETNRRLVA